MRIPVRDLVFDALAEGPVDGELVLLLHGFPEAGIEFEAQLHALAAAGYRAVAPDQRGYSPDARPDDIGEYAMGYLVADVLGIADALGRDRFDLVGHDWGGAVAWVLATRAPERVRTLTVLSTPHFAAFSAQLADSASDQAQRSSYLTVLSAPDAATRVLADNMAILRQLLGNVPAAHRALYLEQLGTPEAIGAALHWYRASGLRPGSGGSGAGSAPAVSPVAVPTLYVWGTEDGAFSRAAAERTAAFVSGPYEFEVLEGIGHWLPELAADTVNALLLRHLANGELPGG
ncbi:MAG: alpha/beta hydrolase [Gemmatimonadota bacterium]